jgi:hypothetical protein
VDIAILGGIGLNCANAGWSAVTSAQANATLAGVLAGFMLNGIVVLLSRMMTEFAKVRTLALLFTAFVALGLDSYLFGLVTGDSSCRRAWSEAMLAAGLLGMGAVAIIAGFGFLVAEYVPTRGNPESVRMVKTLFNALRGGVALVVLTVLWMTSWNYLYAALGNGVPTFAKALLWAYFGFGLVAAISVTVKAGVLTWVQRLNVLPQTWQHTISRWVAGPDNPNRQVKVAIYSSFTYTVASVIAASFFARTSPRPWDHPGLWEHVAFGATLVWVLGFSLVPLFYLLVRCSPPFRDDGDVAHPGEGERPVAVARRVHLL